MMLKKYDGTVIEHPEWDDVDAYLDSLAQDGPLFAILKQKRMYYLQAHINDEGLFEMEFREGSDERHYHVDFACSRELMTEAFKSYFYGDNRWRTLLEWRRGTGAA
ncbi:hypothetical protein L0U85_09345 [Glycomyces sp. L485]|uniref:hypothetical protein n=1 Tax=Glycomyces sp. L485 TaxID=2909235 RepID=UPI001F4AE461|nr:hypothetical protein [Glycomyces sp. L485]MCH7231054.1 hypothetical protein [Glycomyces sp. L485]